MTDTTTEGPTIESRLEALEAEVAELKAAKPAASVSGTIEGKVAVIEHALVHMIGLDLETAAKAVLPPAEPPAAPEAAEPQAG